MQRQSLPAAALAFALVAFIAGYQFGHRGGLTGAAASDGQLSCSFSPRGGCTEVVVEHIDAAKTTIKVLAYSFTSKPIVDALIRAHKRGVKVELVLDKSIRTERHLEADACVEAGIKTWVDSEHAIAHNKVMLIDGRTLITGSFNFTYQAEHSNGENLLIVQDRPAIYNAYDANFEEHRGHSQGY